MKKNDSTAPLSLPVFRQISAIAARQDVPAFVVGGYVRDFYLGRPSTDIDVVVVGSGIGLAEELGRELRTKVSVYKTFGTAALRTRGVEVEFVGARKESYVRDSRKPQVEAGTLEDDQRRRDFTINAMAWSLAEEDFGRLVDPFDGMRDLHEGIIRTPCDPDVTFSDDPLRMMRAVRFCAQLGFSMETETREAIRALAPSIGRVSAERIRTELQSKNAALKEAYVGYTEQPEITASVQEALSKRSSGSVKAQKNAEIEALGEKEQEQTEALSRARNAYILQYPSSGFSGSEKSNEGYEQLLAQYETDFEPQYRTEFEKQCDFIYRSLRENVIATIHGDIKAAKRHAAEINRLLKKTNFSDSIYQIKIEPAYNENGQFYDMLMAPELDSKNLDNDGFEGQLSLGEDSFYQKYEAKIKLLTDKFMPVRDDDERVLEQHRREMEQYADYRNYLSFSMYEQVTDADGNVIRENFVDDMAGRDSGGEGQNPKYVALLAGFAMLYMQQTNRDSRIKLVLLDEAFSKMDQERSAVCLKYARQMDLQLIVCVPDERLQSLIRNVDCVYGFRRHKNQISMMHIDKGNYLEMLEGAETEKTGAGTAAE